MFLGGGLGFFFPNQKLNNSIFLSPERQNFSGVYLQYRENLRFYQSSHRKHLLKFRSSILDPKKTHLCIYRGNI